MADFNLTQLRPGGGGSSGGGAAKSVQRITIYFSSGYNTVDISISEVNPDKCFIIIHTPTTSPFNFSYSFPDSTTITIDRHWTSGNLTLYFTLVELT